MELVSPHDGHTVSVPEPGASALLGLGWLTREDHAAKVAAQEAEDAAKAAAEAQAAKETVAPEQKPKAAPATTDEEQTS